MPLVHQIDGFPLQPEDSDYAIQQAINDFLTGPPGGLPGLRRVLRGVPQELRPAWVLPLLRRAEWLADHRELPQAVWLNHLMNSVREILRDEGELRGRTPEHDQRLLELMFRVKVFRKTNHTQTLRESMPLLASAFHKTTKKEEWTPVLQSAYLELEQFEDPRDGHYAFGAALALLREGIAPAPVSCWSSAMTSDLAAMKKARAAEWWSLFNAGHGPKVSAAIQKISETEFVQQFDLWTRGLDAQTPIPLSWFGAEALNILLNAACEIPASAPILERIAKVNWSPAQRAGVFLNHLIRAAAPLPKAAELLEPLAYQNPGNATLHVALTDPGADRTPIGIDGYPLDEKPEHASFHRRIDDWFRLPGNRFRTPGPDIRTLSLGPDGKPDFTGLLAAMLDRIGWLWRQGKLVTKGDDYRMMLAEYLHGVAEKTDLDEGGLNRLLDLDAQGALYCAPNEWLLPYVEKRAAKAGLDGDLLTRVQAWHDAAYGNVAGQNLRHKLGWLLWHDDPRTIKPARCWSAIIREDLRRMSPESAKHWRELLRKTTFTMVNTPPAKLRKECAPVLETIGSGAFADRFHTWLRPFAGSDPVSLEVPGRDVLRCLLWHARDIHDARIDEALTWFPPAAWKNKKCEGYANRLLGPYVYAVSSRPPEFAHLHIEKLVSRQWIVTGDKHYEVYRQLCELLNRQPIEGKAPPQDLILQQPEPRHKPSSPAKRTQLEEHRSLGQVFVPE